MHFEEILSTDITYVGPVFSLDRQQVRLENGNVVRRDVIHHSGGVGVLFINNRNEVLLVRQFRAGIRKETIEIPAGKINEGESPEQCGRRELEEECGLVPSSMIPMGCLYPTPAYCEEITWLFEARDCVTGSVHLDEDEFVSMLWIPLEEVIQMIQRGDISDAKTQIAILKYANTHML